MTLKKILYYLQIPWIWMQLTVHNTWGILNVFDIIWLRPMKGGFLNENHPFATGLNPATQKNVWTSNIAFRSKRNTDTHDLVDTDEQIIESVAGYLKDMGFNAASTKAHPHGKPHRMPPGILYIHAGLHYNGFWLIFNDFKDGITHFSCPEFRKEFLRLVNTEKREPVTVFRCKDYDRQEYIEFASFLRTVLPYFSNSNGNKKRVGWGNPSPYPAVNTITGNWMPAVRSLQITENQMKAVREPLNSKLYFQGNYSRSERSTVTSAEKLLAKFTVKRVELRGEKGNLFFVDRRKLNGGFRFDPADMPGPIEKAKRMVKVNLKQTRK